MRSERCEIFQCDADDDENQPQLFEMNREWTPFGDNERLVTVNVSPVGEDEEDQILENEDWWQGDGDQNGTATETATRTGTGTETDGDGNGDRRALIRP